MACRFNSSAAAELSTDIFSMIVSKLADGVKIEVMNAMGRNINQVTTRKYIEPL